MSSIRNIRLEDERATETFARKVAALLPDEIAGWLLLLEGDLGAGKSTFARAMIRAFGHTGPVPSPTYTLIEPYTLPRGRIYHVDLYRVVSEDELCFLGLAELDDGLTLVEWPERAPALARRGDLCISLAYDGDGRIAGIRGVSERGVRLVEHLGPETDTDPSSS